MSLLCLGRWPPSSGPAESGISPRCLKVPRPVASLVSCSHYHAYHALVTQRRANKGIDASAAVVVARNRMSVGIDEPPASGKRYEGIPGPGGASPRFLQSVEERMFDPDTPGLLPVYDAIATATRN